MSYRYRLRSRKNTIKEKKKCHRKDPVNALNFSSFKQVRNVEFSFLKVLWTSDLGASLVVSRRGERGNGDRRRDGVGVRDGDGAGGSCEAGEEKEQEQGGARRRATSEKVTVLGPNFID